MFQGNFLTIKRPEVFQSILLVYYSSYLGLELMMGTIDISCSSALPKMGDYYIAIPVTHLCLSLYKNALA